MQEKQIKARLKESGEWRGWWNAMKCMTHEMKWLVIIKHKIVGNNQKEMHKNGKEKVIKWQ